MRIFKNGGATYNAHLGNPWFLTNSDHTPSYPLRSLLSSFFIICWVYY